MFTNINTAASASACVLTTESGATTTSFTGNAYVTSYEVTAQAGSVVRATIQLQFTNAPEASTILTVA